MSDRYSYSSLQEFKRCPLAFRLSRIEGLELREEAGGVESHHLAFGSAGHEGLQTLYQNNYSSLEPGDLYLALDAAKSNFRLAYPIHLDPTDKAKSPENGLIMLEQYVKRWKEEDRRWKIVDCEGLDTGDFESGLGAVRLDLVVEDLEYGGIYGVDHKITSSAQGRKLSASWWSQFDPNSQITHYVDYITEKYGRCDGFFINAIGLSWTEEKKSNGASNVFLFEVDDAGRPWKDFSHSERRFIKGNKHRDMMAAWGLTCRFERQMFNRTPGQIEQERASTKQWIDTIECQMEVASNVQWPFNTSSCSYCQFKPLCSAGWAWPQDEETIGNLYRQVCREVIELPCPRCGGNGCSIHYRESALRNFTDAWDSMRPGELVLSIPPCDKCEGSGLVPGPRCVLDRGHADDHADTLPEREEIEILVVEGSSDE